MEDVIEDMGNSLRVIEFGTANRKQSAADIPFREGQ